MDRVFGCAAANDILFRENISNPSHGMPFSTSGRIPDRHSRESGIEVWQRAWSFDARLRGHDGLHEDAPDGVTSR
ncbi:MAG: hypothetical protein WDN01_15030 [Rhizomicrobium sp.]